MTADLIWIDWLCSDLPSSRASTKQRQIRPFTEHLFLLPFIPFTVHCFMFDFSFFFFLLNSHLPPSSSSSTSSLWIIHGVIHNLGETARDLHSSLCHWVLFGSIFNNCLIYQIDWELGAGAPCAALPDMSDYGRGERQILPAVRDSAWLPGELPTPLQQQ